MAYAKREWRNRRVGIWVRVFDGFNGSITSLPHLFCVLVLSGNKEMEAEHVLGIYIVPAANFCGLKMWASLVKALVVPPLVVALCVSEARVPIYF